MRDYKRLIKSIRSHNNREIGCYECEYLLGKKSIADPICIKRMLNDAAEAI